LKSDLIALLLSFAYVGAVVAVGEGARRAGLSREWARKIIHVGVGLWVFGTLALFQSRYMAAIPPAAAAAGNWVIHRYRLLKAMEDEPENLGTVWFPIAFSILVLLGWEQPGAVAGGITAMTLGDAAAAVVGQRWGQHRYEAPGGFPKSLEGSLTMLAVTFAVLLLILGPGAPGPAALAAVTAMCAEALGAKGRDNLWVPLATAAVLAFAIGMPPAAAGALGLGAVLAVAVGILAWWKGSLTPGGVLGATTIGTLLFGLGGWPGALALMGFFLSSSLLSRLFRTQARKAQAEAEYAKGGTRDLGQSMANGGMAGAAALLLGLTGDPRWLGAAVGALAAANADTWATELGVLSRAAPRLITSFRPAEAGASGAVSAAGTLAALGGAAFVGAAAALGRPELWRFLPWAALAGLAGSLVDSLLGATLQGVYWCPVCGKETERRRHRCGTETVLHRGHAWLGNDTVNLLATAAGGLIGFLAFGR
jgi:uncharacterized protein (TIGR00297 family)